MSTEIVKPTENGKPVMLATEKGFFQPKTLDELYRFSQYISKSEFVPKSLANKPVDERVFSVFAAIQFGAELGLSPMASIQNISVVNGQPSTWGDVQLALVRASGLLEDFEESEAGKYGEDSFEKICRVKRKGDKKDTIERFSIGDARKANLWGKSGTWSTHPKRMLKYKARAFALRDAFPDVLKGLHSAEEMEGEILDVKSNPVPSTSFLEVLDAAEVKKIETPNTSEKSVIPDIAVPENIETPALKKSRSVGDVIREQTHQATILEGNQ